MAGLLGRGGIYLKILSSIAEGESIAAKMTILSWGQFLNGSEFQKLSRGHLAKIGGHTAFHKYTNPVIGYILQLLLLGTRHPSRQLARTRKPPAADAGIH